MMNKRLLSLLVTALLLAALLPAAAFAEGSLVVSLGSVRAGAALDQQIATTSSGKAALTGGSLPDGCTLVTEDRGDQSVHYLRGTPSVAGTREFTIEVTDSYTVVPAEGEEGEETVVTVTIASLSCSITVLPAIPSYTLRDVDCFVGEHVKLELTVTLADSGTLSYQWYENTVRDNQNGELMEGKTERELELDMEFVGTSYYYCVITNNNNGMTETVKTQAAAVKVTEPEITSLAIASLPTKLEYEEGDELDTKGLKLLINYSNGTSVTDDEGFTVSPKKLEKAGTQTITVTYQGKTVTFPVVVNEAKETVDRITVTTLPSKRDYQQGERLDTAGLVLEVVTSKGNKSTVTSGFTCDPEVLNTSGLQLITVKYENQTTTFTVTVRSGDASILAIAVAIAPSKLSYTVGETFDSSGMVLRVTTDHGEENVRNGFSCSPSRFTQAGRQLVTISYGGHECSLEVTVAAAEGGEIVVETEKPVSPAVTPTVTPRPGSGSGSSRDGGSTMLVLIIFFALVALVALLAYAYVSKRDAVRAWLRRMTGRDDDE